MRIEKKETILAFYSTSHTADSRNTTLSPYQEGKKPNKFEHISKNIHKINGYNTIDLTGGKLQDNLNVIKRSKLDPKDVNHFCDSV